MLKRAELRRLIKRKLINKTAAGDRVHVSLPFSTEDDECPIILIYTPQENASTPARHVPMFTASLTINIEVRVVEDYKTAVDTLDQMCAAIETIILEDQEFLGEIESVSSINTQIGQEDGGQYALFLAIISLTVEYKKEIKPRIDDQFQTARVNVDAINPHDPNLASSGPDGRIEAVADIIIDQD